MAPLLSYIKTPYVAFIALASSAAVGGGLFMGYHYLSTDPTVVLRKKLENPFPYLNLRQDKNIKLYAVSNKFDKESGVRESF